MHSLFSGTTRESNPEPFDPKSDILTTIPPPPFSYNLSTCSEAIPTTDAADAPVSLCVYLSLSVGYFNYTAVLVAAGVGRSRNDRRQRLCVSADGFTGLLTSVSLQKTFRFLSRRISPGIALAANVRGSASVEL